MGLLINRLFPYGQKYKFSADIDRNSGGRAYSLNSYSSWKLPYLFTYNSSKMKTKKEGFYNTKI